jgi:hypothetical protein
MNPEINSVQLVFNFKTVEKALQFLSSISGEKHIKEKSSAKEEAVQPQPERVMIKKPDKKYCTPAEIAEIFSLNVNTLANLRAQKRGPVFFKAGKKILYSIQEVEQWLVSRKRKTVDEHFSDRG